ncbi:lipid A Kdo2 1-phosphate O-methyltransferase [Leptospira sp. 2 VSF19]|uniref:Lipid A Kdo2 1-phosphate O-methyltransferase n=1 Tax=Leptospira soteropolitanensis TaxID=2950025 RepID=A0AAW5VHK9_9LEPT|nr:lipid A Kdo2 1-phosphate O-methyltransferase [Leptospira soteropolitanensis]MCW7493481.1 lipid A Kdo2 1-phosphate O-methyltransferase [Leptospira soteropolitanensis]MCW7500987.1 lipid A Kdo2 1-phosphate O-methyltransferase [Leptospira soteropolitanensis]MCW7523333.1 lipid A Kdo2 1-phosphate O-methyltransferase [Leptospira soteropolitanensis]MCW7527194.1 lipid A Kdo2 1-phosphate O-methyltransferase [Leptospira soteropolitanensis]MCW7531051.1 lipid A Kdo2 1-phosphate O-methyltransferase [Lept
MALIEELNQQGNFLFRWRSYIPGVILFLSLLYLPYVPYFQGSYESNLYWLSGAFLVSIAGLFVRCFTIGYTPKNTSGRNTKQQVADVVNQSGIYSLVRHPLYVGNFLMYLGPVFILRDFAFALVYIMFFYLYYERIIFAEEYFLRGKFAEGYLKWADKTPAFIPRLSGYIKPNLDFSFRNIWKREYPSLFGIIVVFTVFDLIQVYFQEPALRAVDITGIWKPFHTWFFGFGFVFYVVTRIIVKTTKLLEVEGR